MITEFKLWQMRRNLRRGTRSYAKYIDEAKGEEREFRIQEASNEADIAREEILNTSSMIVCEKAERLGLPVPAFSDKESWEEGFWAGRHRLTVKAQAGLRQAIRNERREQWSFAAFLLKDVLTPIIGGIGAIMGLVSLLHALKGK